MPLIDYVVKHDKFKCDDREFPLSFPCCACEYRTGNDYDEPCISCQHNLGCELDLEEK